MSAASAIDLPAATAHRFDPSDDIQPVDLLGGTKPGDSVPLGTGGPDLSGPNRSVRHDDTSADVAFSRTYPAAVNGPFDDWMEISTERDSGGRPGPTPDETRTGDAAAPSAADASVMPQRTAAVPPAAISPSQDLGSSVATVPARSAAMAALTLQGATATGGAAPATGTAATARSLLNALITSTASDRSTARAASTLSGGGDSPFGSAPTFAPATLAHPGWVVDANKGAVLSESVVNQDFSEWAVDLRAQVNGATVTGYSWDTSAAPDATSVSGDSTYRLQFTWGSFTDTAARSDAVSLTTTFVGGGSQTQTFHFWVTSTASPAWTTAPTSISTWPAVVTPDRLADSAATQAGVSHYSLGLADGSVRTDFALPAYNPNVAPLDFVYNSTAADARPRFLTRYELDPGQPVPSQVEARLTFNGTAGSWVYYDTSTLNPGDFVQLPLQADATGLSTGYYAYQVEVTALSGTPVTSTYTGSAGVVNDASSPFGAGWSLGGLDKLVAATGGVLLVQSGGRARWFADAGSGAYTRPAGDFSTLVQNGGGTWTRTLDDGTVEQFDTAGKQTSVADRNGNAVSYTYSSGRLSTITDQFGQVTTLAYDTNGHLSSVADPAGRPTTATVTFGGQLTDLTDPAGGHWQYAYDSAGRLMIETDPRSQPTTFGYDAVSHRASTVSRPDGYTESLTSLQTQGLPASGTGTSGSPATAMLTAQAVATFIDGRGQEWDRRLDWAGFGATVQATDPQGDVSTDYRDANGLTWLDNDADSRRTRFQFDSQGHTTRLTQPNDGLEQYQYNGFGEVTVFSNPESETTTDGYDAAGNPTTVTDPLNHTTTLTYTTHGLVRTVTDPNNNVTTYGYDALDRLQTVTDALNEATTLGYDSAGNLTAVTDALNHTTTFGYDGMGRQTGMTLPDASGPQHYSYTYDGLGNVQTQTDPLNHTTTLAYDAVGRLQTTTDALNHTTSYTHDGTGDLTGVTDALNHTTSFDYDNAGRMTAEQLPGQSASHFDHDPYGNVTRSTDPLGRTTDYGWTLNNQLGNQQNPDGSQRKVYFCGCGCPEGVNLQIDNPMAGAAPGTPDNAYGPGIGPGGSALQRDAAGRVTQVTDADRVKTYYGYDAAGNPTTATDGLGHASTNAYDALNRVKSVTDANGGTTTYAYDAAGNLQTATDALNQVTRYGYDYQNRRVTTTDPRGGVTTLAYDTAGHTASLTDPVGNLTQYGYDAAGRLTTETDPRNQVATYAYDDAGRLMTATDRDGRERTFGYDDAGHKTSEHWLNGGTAVYTATYAYNAAGELTNAADNASSYTYTYDATTGQLRTEDNVGTPGAPRVTLSYGYDPYYPSGRLTSVADNRGGEQDIYYTFAGREYGLSLTAAGGSVNPQMAFLYDRAGRQQYAWRWEGNGTPWFVDGVPQSGPEVQTQYGYDVAGRVTSIDHASIDTATVALSSFAYGYDGAGRLIDSTGPEGALSYSYDATDQLTGVSGARSESFSYDSNGNRTMAGYATGTGNRLLADGTFNYTYDDVGNTLTQTRISDGQVTDYAWDDRNRLTDVQVKTAGGTLLHEEQYTYDVFDRRIGVAVDASGTGSFVRTWTAYEGANAWADFDDSGNVTARYLNGLGLDERYARVDAAGNVAWYLTDNLGSVRQIVKTDGTVLDDLTYSAFGGILSETSPSNGDRFKYAGREWDAGTGQYYNRARYYAADSGRFRSDDPSAFASGDVNLYRYAANNPTAFVDPTGLLLQDPRTAMTPIDRQKYDELTKELADARKRYEAAYAKAVNKVKDKLIKIDKLIKEQDEFIKELYTKRKNCMIGLGSEYDKQIQIAERVRKILVETRKDIILEADPNLVALQKEILKLFAQINAILTKYFGVNEAPIQGSGIYEFFPIIW